MSVLKVCIILTAAVIFLSGFTVKAAVVQFLAPFGNFALADPNEPKPGGAPTIYASSGAGPDWLIAQWHIPGGRLPPFLKDARGGVQIFTSAAPEASVQITRSANGEAVELTQDGAVLPCAGRGGSPRESDLLIAPIARNASSHSALQTAPLPLKNLGSLNLVAELGIRFGVTRSPKGCEVNQGEAFVSLILNDLVVTPHQTLFYKIGLNEPCGPGTDARMRLCRQGAGALAFYSKANPFGVDDRLALVGQPFLVNGERRRIAISLMERIREVIESGPAFMDHDPSHWVVDSAYAGQHIWGDFLLTSKWYRFQVQFQTN